MRRLPVYGWLGLVIMLASEAGMLARIDPFFSWHTPTAWTGYILLADALVWKRRGDSWIRSRGGEFLFLVAASIPLWVIFELYNKYTLQNWYYVGLPENLHLRYFGYIWSFATIWPAIFETGDLVSTLRDRRADSHRADRPVPERLGPLAWTSVASGALLLLVPIAYPSPYLAAPVWLGFIFLLDPLNARGGAESILGDFRRGRTRRLVNLLAAGILCGVLWEFWNYWAGTRGIYNVPIPPSFRIFEMPILGFRGVPPVPPAGLV